MSSSPKQGGVENGAGISSIVSPQEKRFLWASPFVIPMPRLRFRQALGGVTTPAQRTHVPAAILPSRLSPVVAPRLQPRLARLPPAPSSVRHKEVPACGGRVLHVTGERGPPDAAFAAMLGALRAELHFPACPEGRGEARRGAAPSCRAGWGLGVRPRRYGAFPGVRWSRGWGRGHASWRRGLQAR